MKIKTADLKKGKNFLKKLPQSVLYTRVNVVLTNNAFHL